MVGFYNVLLDMRKEISKSIKDEIEFRRKMAGSDFDPDDIDNLLDIGEISKQVEKFKEEKLKIQAKRLTKSKGMKELEEKGIEIPGLKELKETEGET